MAAALHLIYSQILEFPSAIDIVNKMNTSDAELTRCNITPAMRQIFADRFANQALRESALRTQVILSFLRDPKFRVQFLDKNDLNQPTKEAINADERKNLVINVLKACAKLQPPQAAAAPAKEETKT